MLYGRTKDIINKFYSPWDGFLINVTYERLRTELRADLDWSADYWELDKVGRVKEIEKRGEERGRVPSYIFIWLNSAVSYYISNGCAVLYADRCLRNHKNSINKTCTLQLLLRCHK